MVDKYRQYGVDEMDKTEIESAFQVWWKDNYENDEALIKIYEEGGLGVDYLAQMAASRRKEACKNGWYAAVEIMKESCT